MHVLLKWIIDSFIYPEAGGGDLCALDTRITDHPWI